MGTEFISNLVTLIARLDELAAEVTRWRATTSDRILANYYNNVLVTMNSARLEFVKLLASVSADPLIDNA
ncbi:MAG: hypothetical protein H0X30_03785 [Anaerolineae bacterium]|nr:hypothetical protein [Anaerolineae bacterium]